MLLDDRILLRMRMSHLSAMMKSMALANIIGLFFYSVFFSLLSIWHMTVLCGIYALIWGGVFILNARGKNRLAYWAGIVISTIFSLLVTWLLGWNSGFFLLTLSIIPLIFRNYDQSRNLKVILVLGILSILTALFVLSWNQTAVWEIDPSLLRILSILNLLFTVIVLALIGFTFEKANAEAEEALVISNNRLLDLSATDPVTNLVNRRIMLSRIEQEKLRMQRGSKPFSLIMVDVDNFKQINEEYGHSGGDYALVYLAEMISLSLRKLDELARWGGDEFLIMLPETDLEGGIVVAEKIRSRIMTKPFFYHETQVPMTVTLGVGMCDLGSGVANCIRKADQALDLGKRTGKNRVSIIQQV